MSDIEEERLLYPAPRVVQTNRKPLYVRGEKTKTYKEPHINLEVMRDVMFAPFEEFMKIEGAKTANNVTRNRRHIFIDRGSPVLFVAHLDTVQEPTHFWANLDYIACPTIDNRLGAWVGMHGLPAMGLYPDVLLTEGEEKSNSSGQDFAKSKQYNFLVSFDRMNDDVAMYGFLDEGWVSTCAKYELKGVKGSYSDISSMEYMGCKGMNVGCGMERYHDKESYTTVSILIRQMKRFASFAADNWNTHFPHKKEEPKYGGNNYLSANDENKDKSTNTSVWKYFWDNVLTPDEWWHMAAQKERGGKNLTFCATCRHYFETNDVVHSSTRNKNFCLSCFSLEMLPQGLNNVDSYHKDVQRILLARREAQQKEGSESYG